MVAKIGLCGWCRALGRGTGGQGDTPDFLAKFINVYSHDHIRALMGLRRAWDSVGAWGRVWRVALWCEAAGVWALGVA